MLTSPDQYPTLIEQLGATGGTTLAFRRSLALAVFEQSARYDRAIADYLGKSEALAEAFPANSLAPIRLPGPSSATGRTPTSGPRSTSSRARPGPSVATAKILHGKELSYNNLLDLDSQGSA